MKQPLDNSTVGQPLGNALLERLPHINASRLYGTTLKGAQLFGEELIERLLPALRAEPERSGGLEIAHHGNELRYTL